MINCYISFYSKGLWRHPWFDNCVGHSDKTMKKLDKKGVLSIIKSLAMIVIP